ncbi:SAM-dependent methyltransferase [Geotalea daltonii FRC-32]|uniref:SAM-dependent methyltransferase n=1 Tax=Geotalea daltonii (strain DSM 22248 / JCM 15807 / FRC-32) TaxID=316067 RepID=B9M584_GEODF|nr:tRNA1(Val) (adenine(37)-N6)-methyltransferase [Geotalea daltonii]ACM19839.1 SAM-dependent methyltransferase [Geotalea daltonii FRC-32]
MDEITIDELRGDGLKIAQPLNGYRFSLDPILLSNFARLREGGRIADLGTGCGIIPLLLAKQNKSATIVGIDFQEHMAALARHNVILNGYDDRVSILTEDIASLKGHFPVSSFDLVVSNPPYRKPGTGRVSPKAGRDKARHETTATLADFMSMAKYLVKPAGRICFIYHVSRLVELFAEAVALKLAPLRLRMIHDNALSEAGMFMVELAKGRGGDMIIDPPLLVRDAHGGYSPEMSMLLGIQPVGDNRQKQGKGGVNAEW